MSVRKRDVRYKKRWLATVHGGRDGRGRTIRTMRSFDRQADAVAWERREGTRLANLQRLPGDPITIGQLLADWIQQGRELHDWSPRHLANSTRLVERVLTPLHPIRIDNLTSTMIEDLFGELRVRGVSLHTIRQARNSLRAALNLAMRRQLIDRNVAALARAPEVKRKPPTVISADQLDSFLEALTGDRLRPFYIVAMTLALRPGEAIGLRWEDVDFAGRRVRIAQTIQYSGKRYHVRPTPKNDQVRSIPLPDVTLRALETQRLDQQWEKGDAETWTDSGLVFTNETGGPLHGPHARRHLQRLCERAGLPRVTLYQLRHTGATLLLQLGVPLEQIQKIMGHSTLQMTVGYAQVSEELQRDAMGLLDRWLDDTRTTTRTTDSDQG